MSDSREEQRRDQVQCAECGDYVERLEICPGCGELMCANCVDTCECDE